MIQIQINKANTDAKFKPKVVISTMFQSIHPGDWDFRNANKK